MNDLPTFIQVKAMTDDSEEPIHIAVGNIRGVIERKTETVIVTEFGRVRCANKASDIMIALNMAGCKTIDVVPAKVRK